MVLPVSKLEVDYVRKLAIVFGLLLVASFLIGSAQPTAAQTEPVLTVAVSVAPLGGIVQKIGNSYIDVVILLPEGVEPHAAQMPPGTLAAALEADLLVLTGHYAWEDQVVNQTGLPVLTLTDYEEFGAVLSPMPMYVQPEAALAQDHSHDGENPHAYWLLPSNAVAIANATMHAFQELHPELADYWEASFNDFVGEVEAFKDLVAEADTNFHFSLMHAVVVFPAEAYVAEALGITVTAALQQGDNVFISGADLLEVQTSLINGSVDFILGSDVARLQAGGEFANQLAEDTGSTVIWVRAIFFSGLSDYLSIMTYNLGAVSTALENEALPVPSPVLNYFLAGAAGFLGIVVLVETVLLYNGIKSED
jgi:ABC-type Zn uptake system ZnuABC Zn-binding protein ZnuA